MVETTVSAFDARRKFGKVLDRVKGEGESVIVERHGEPVAVVVPVAIYRQWQQQQVEARARLLTRFQEMSEHANMSTDDAETLAAEIVADARASRRRNTTGAEHDE